MYKITPKEGKDTLKINMTFYGFFYSCGIKMVVTSLFMF